MHDRTAQESSGATWAVIVLLALGFLLFSFFVYTAVGNRGQPSWDYGTVEDVPAGSPYAVYGKLPDPQHVQGARGE